MPARRTPGSIPNRMVAAATMAPVFPALTQAWAVPDLTRSIATRMEEFFFRLSAYAGWSPISTICEAGKTVSLRERRQIGTGGRVDRSKEIPA